MVAERDRQDRQTRAQEVEATSLTATFTSRLSATSTPGSTPSEAVMRRSHPARIGRSSFSAATTSLASGMSASTDYSRMTWAPSSPTGTNRSTPFSTPTASVNTEKAEKGTGVIFGLQDLFGSNCGLELRLILLASRFGSRVFRSFWLLAVFGRRQLLSSLESRDGIGLPQNGQLPTVPTSELGLSKHLLRKVFTSLLRT